MRNPFRWLLEVLSTDTSDRPEAADRGPDREPAALYECSKCAATYIGVDKQSCSRCGEPVREIPSERDLAGFGGDR